MLLVWVFALASSWANACLLQDRVATHGPVAQQHGVHDDAADHGSDGARQLCLSVCEDEQGTLPKVVTPPMPDLGPPALVPGEPWAFCAAQAQFPNGCPLAAALPPEAAVAIRFLRLTI